MSETNDEWTYSTEQYIEDVRDSRDEDAEGDPIGVGNQYVQEDGTRTYDKSGNVTQEDVVLPTLLGDVYTEEQKANDRPLEETLSVGDEPFITGTGLPGVDEAAEELGDVDTVSVEDASEGFTRNEDVDQTPDPDVYEWNGNVPGETATAEEAEVSANPSNMAEQDPSLSGDGIVTGGADPYQPPSADPAPKSGSGSGGVGGMGAVALAGVAALAALGMNGGGN